MSRFGDSQNDSTLNQYVGRTAANPVAGTAASF